MGEEKNKMAETGVIETGVIEVGATVGATGRSPVQRVCLVCQKETTGQLYKGKCKRCYQRDWAQEKKTKMQAKAQEEVGATGRSPVLKTGRSPVQEDVDRMMEEHAKTKEQAIEHIIEQSGLQEKQAMAELVVQEQAKVQETKPSPPPVVTVDFGEYPELWEKITAAARAEFRTYELQMLYWISEMDETRVSND